MSDYRTYTPWLYYATGLTGRRCYRCGITLNEREVSSEMNPTMRGVFCLTCHSILTPKPASGMVLQSLGELWGCAEYFDEASERHLLGVVEVAWCDSAGYDPEGRYNLLVSKLLHPLGEADFHVLWNLYAVLEEHRNWTKPPLSDLFFQKLRDGIFTLHIKNLDAQIFARVRDLVWTYYGGKEAAMLDADIIQHGDRARLILRSLADALRGDLRSGIIAVSRTVEKIRPSAELALMLAHGCEARWLEHYAERTAAIAPYFYGYAARELHAPMRLTDDERDRKSEFENLTNQILSAMISLSRGEHDAR